MRVRILNAREVAMARFGHLPEERIHSYEAQALLKCCSNFGAIPIIDNKTIGCEPKEAEKPDIAGPGS